MVSLLPPTRPPAPHLLVTRPPPAFLTYEQSGGDQATTHDTPHHLIIHQHHLHLLLSLLLPLYEMIKHQYIFSSTDCWLVDDGGFVFICCYNYQHRNTTIASDFYVIILRAMFEFPSAEQICTVCKL